MKKLWLVVAASILSACSKAPAPQTAGEAYFRGYGCVKCHQLGGEGHAWGPDLTFVGFRKSPEWLDAWLKNPHSWKKNTVMPNFNLPEDVRKELVKYLSEQKGQAFEKTGRPWAAESDSVAQGRVLFEKAGCVACHGQNGKGGFPNNNVVGGLIPSLTKVSDGYTKQELLAKIKGGVTPASKDPSQPAPMIKMPKWGDVLKDDEINAVVDYLFTLSAGAASSPDSF
jgi:mono/diheme cytochrome c family protein